jgi:hypothetical protein
MGWCQECSAFNNDNNYIIEDLLNEIKQQNAIFIDDLKDILNSKELRKEKLKQLKEFLEKNESVEDCINKALQEIR